jgi:hypothetical protein
MHFPYPSLFYLHRPSHSPSPEQLKVFGEKYVLYARESTTLNNVVVKIKDALSSLIFFELFFGFHGWEPHFMNFMFYKKLHYGNI